MSDEFRIDHEGPLPGTPDEVWDAFTDDSDAWQMPWDMSDTSAVVWERPRHMVLRTEIGDWFNQIEVELEPTDTGSYVRYVHSGIFTSDWDTQYDGARRHTEFYMNALATYLTHFRGLTHRHVDVVAPAASITPDGLTRLRDALGMPADVTPGDAVSLSLPGGVRYEAVVDFANEAFIGLHTDSAMFRIFGRNHFGMPVAVGVYEYSASDTVPEGAVPAFTELLDSLYTDEMPA